MATVVDRLKLCSKQPLQGDQLVAVPAGSLLCFFCPLLSSPYDSDLAEAETTAGLHRHARCISSDAVYFIRRVVHIWSIYPVSYLAFTISFQL
jgi:hypothetical protein